MERQQAEEAHATVLPNGTGDDTVRKRGYSKVKSPIAALDGKVRLQNSNREGDLLTMKKTIAAVSLIIALVMAGPVAAAGIDFGGSIETNIEVNRSVEGEVDVNPASSSASTWASPLLKTSSELVFSSAFPTSTLS